MTGSVMTDGCSDNLLSAKTDLTQRKFVFIHIPKCGGTYLTALLKASIKNCRLHPERFEDLHKAEPHELAAHNFFSGHFDFFSAGLIPGEKAIFTTFRDPIRRLLSFYDFQRAHRPDLPEHTDLPLVQLANRLSFLEFVHKLRGHIAVNNPYVRTFLDRRSINGSIERLSEDEKTELLEVDPEMCIAIAAWNIRSLQAWIFVEDFSFAIEQLLRLLGLQAAACVADSQSLNGLMEEGTAFRRIQRTELTDGDLVLAQEQVSADLALMKIIGSEVPRP